MRHYCVIHIDSLDGGTGKTCLGGGMHCPSASSCKIIFESRAERNSSEVTDKRVVANCSVFALLFMAFYEILRICFAVGSIHLCAY